KKVALAGDFHGADIFGPKIRRTFRRIADIEIPDKCEYQTQHASRCNGIAPAIVATKPQGNRRQRECSRSGTEMAPAAINTFGCSQLMRRKPFGNHADTNDKTGANGTEEKAGNRRLQKAV